MNFPLLQYLRGKQISIALILIFIGVLAIDQVTKRHAHNTLLKEEYPTGQTRQVSYNVGSIGKPYPEQGDIQFFVNLDFTYARNTGAAFSIGADWPDYVRVPFFFVVTLLCILYIGYYLKTLPINYYLTRFGLVMIVSGAIGNFIDRLIQGYVIDFVDVNWNLFGWEHNFAIFNVADIAINIGIIAFILEVLLRRKAVFATFQKNESA